MSVDVGYYSVPDGVSDDPATREGERLCVPGQYCWGGVKQPCSGGRYSKAYGQTACDVCPIGKSGSL